MRTSLSERLLCGLQMHRVMDDQGNAIGFRLDGEQSLMPVISNQKTIDGVKRQFPYLATPPISVAGRPGVMPRKVAALDFQVIADDTERIPCVPWLSIRSFPVFHGGDYVSLGFAIGGPGVNPSRPEYPLVYISDCKAMPEHTRS